GYLRNPLATALRTGKSRLIGMVVPDISNPYHSGIAKAATDVFSEHGYSVLLSGTASSVAEASSQMQAMLEARVEGILYGAAHLDDPALDFDRGLGARLVLYNRQTRENDHPSVVPDERSVIVQAFGHLFTLGHRRIAHLGGPEDLSSTHLRL